jgi:hypothetical protein
MQQAGNEMLDIVQEAAQSNYHILLNVLNADHNEQPFTHWSHYPKGDVHDRGNGALWFYHAHEEDQVARPWDEHGHFHLFVYTEHVPDTIQPLALPAEPDYEKGGLCHLAAVSFSNQGLPIRLFTTNRWVSDEWIYPAETVIDLLDRFHVEEQNFSLTSRWLEALIKLYRPQLEWALQERDRAIHNALKKNSSSSFFEDENIEVLSSVPFDLATQIDSIEATLSRVSF